MIEENVGQLIGELTNVGHISGGLDNVEPISGDLNNAVIEAKDYNKLENKPSINGVVLQDNLSLEDLDIQENIDEVVNDLTTRVGTLETNVGNADTTLTTITTGSGV